ncbi:MAG: thioredoxin family protein [Candidatus Omnitrophica bacterium]|nr:thioredoxin family protein [Candidatus Omnitrophota bacterium]
MALVESASVTLGSGMPEFELPDPEGKKHRGRDLFGKKGLLVVFTCNHCPYAQAIWPRLIRLSAWSAPAGVTVVAINPNLHPDYPEDSAPNMRAKIREWKIPFPYLVDETQAVARAFQAQCTPDIYLFDASARLVYHGRFDDNWKDESKVAREELRQAVSDLAEGRPVSSRQFPSMGCSIKWREAR